MNYLYPYGQPINPQQPYESENFNVDEIIYQNNPPQQVVQQKRPSPSYYQLYNNTIQAPDYNRYFNTNYQEMPMAPKPKSEGISPWSSAPDLNYPSEPQSYLERMRSSMQNSENMDSISYAMYGEPNSTNVHTMNTDFGFSYHNLSTSNPRVPVSEGSSRQSKNKNSGVRSFIQRVNHNLIERKRRDVINECIKELDELIPSYKVDVKRHKGAVLKAAIEYIKSNQQNKFPTVEPSNPPQQSLARTDRKNTGKNWKNSSVGINQEDNSSDSDES